MPKINITAAPHASGCRYPAPFNVPCMARSWRRLGDVVGLTQFGVNLVDLAPGAWSSQRHWHAAEDEFVYVLAGSVVLVDNDGEHLLGAGDCAGFKAGEENGHCLQNRGEVPAQLLVVGSRNPEADACDYPDIDLQLPKGPARIEGRYMHKDGRPYE